MQNTSLIKILFFPVMMVMVLTSCIKDPKKPGYVYAPDMFYSRAYESYAPSPLFENGSALTPPDGTIPRGALVSNQPDALDSNSHISFLYKRYVKDTPEGYEQAKSVKNPFKPSKEMLAEGKKIYEVNCGICHGEKGLGDGTLVQNEVYPAVPSYLDRLPTITEGQMFHSITYGKNLMGGYASHVNAEDRWKVILYIQELASVGPFAKSALPQSVADNSSSTPENKPN